ncbi:hypothetical protein F4781DRAFT_21152 [Annulohypoxylon bovei var. microspora]|nr:hypothetical protein F4781DRAFT_21152 [Annulohypoxylon bovei var. microspora]
MHSFRKVYEPISTILDPVSSPTVARDILRNLTFIFLAINAAVSFALILGTLITVSQYSKSISACGIVYIVLFGIVTIVGLFLFIRITYFKSHPLPQAPTGYVRPNMDGDEDLNDHVELGDIGAHHYRASNPYDPAQYYLPSTQNPYQRVNEGNSEYLENEKSPVYMTEGTLPRIAQGNPASHHRESSDTFGTNLTSKYRRFSIEYNPGESSNGNDNGQDILESKPIVQQTHQETHHAAQYSTPNFNRPDSANSVVEVIHQSRAKPFSPSLAQLTSGALGERRRYETNAEAHTALRSNWSKKDNRK